MNEEPIFILDWGIGGLGAYLELRKQLPQVEIVYISDAGYTPYGKVAHLSLRARLETICQKFSPQTLLIACNAASAAAVQGESSLAPEQACILDDAISSLKNAATVGSAALLAGSGTIGSGGIQKALGPSGARMRLRAAQPLSALVEAGQLEGAEAEESVQNVLRDLGDVESIVLACTHYPALLPVFRKLRGDVNWIDPVGLFIQRAIDAFCLGQRGGQGTSTFWTSGDPAQMQISAQRAFQVTIQDVQQFPKDS